MVEVRPQLPCVECATPTLGHRELKRLRDAGLAPAGVRRHCGRGLCTACWIKQDRAARGLAVSRSETNWSREDLLAEVEFLGLADRATLARRLGLAERTLDQALYRAARDGDRRAIAIRERLAV